MLRQNISRKGWTLHYWRTTDKAEVDFVIDKKSSLLPVEVKYGPNKQNSISRAFRSFIEKYNPPEAWVVTNTTYQEIKLKNTIVIFLPFYRIPFQK